MSISSRVKAASWQGAALSLVTLALAGVSAAPRGHSVSLVTEAGSAHPDAGPSASIPALLSSATDAAQCGVDGSQDQGNGDLEVYRERMQQLAFPYNQVNWNAYNQGVEQRARIAARATARKPLSAAALANRWEFIGPTNLQPPTRQNFGQGVVSGRVNGVAYDPTVTSNYWIASATGGIWKTTNNGQSWSFLSQSWPSLETSCVAVHPTDSNTAYAGTGDFPGFGGFYSFGVMKTTDGGATWTNVGRTQFGSVSVSDIIIDPETPQTLIAATGRGRTTRGQVWRSANAGQTWTSVISTQADWSGLSVGARNATGQRRFWAVGHAAGGQILHSMDRGVTWTRVTTPLTAGAQDGLDIAASTISPDTAYLLSGTDRRIFRTTDAGVNWTDITAGFPNDMVAGDNYNWSQSNYDFHISTSQNSGQDVIYVGLRDLVMSSDGGTTWRSAGAVYTDNAVTHDDQHALVPNPRNGAELLVANDGGVYRMIFNPSGNTVSFTSLNATLGVTQLNAADYHPSDPTHILSGAQDNASPVALGDLSRWRGVGGTDGAGCVINQSTPALQFAAARNMVIYRTADEWNTAPSTITPTWGNDRVPVIGRLALDPTRPNLLYAGTNYLWRWNDTTQNWTPRLGGTDLAPGGGTVRAIAVAPSDGNTIYTGSTTGELFLTMNGGASWAQINTGSPALPTRAITSIAVHPTNPFHIVVSLSGTGVSHVWRCADISQVARAWTDVSAGLPDLPVNSLILDRNAPTTRYFVGTDAGVFRTGNGGTSWEDITTPLNLPNVIVSDVRLASTGYLMAATYGRGIWRIDPTAAATRLLLRRPNGGEVVIAGKATTITWDTGGFAPGHTVKIELSRDAGGTYPEVIAANAPDTGSFSWTPQLPVGTTSRIRITSNTDSSITDSSDADFSIVEGSLTVITPNGGEVVRFGAHVTVRWSATSLALTSQTVRIDLSRDGGQTFNEVIADSVSTLDGQFDWVVSAPGTTSARIRV
ncbi:MAG: glycosyl hydrolase, partial [Armatimonadetes bacterium]|nr:glycosyl hydrolase [Armatimonadota bacterium]